MRRCRVGAWFLRSFVFYYMGDLKYDFFDFFFYSGRIKVFFKELLGWVILGKVFSIVFDIVEV